jgi:hypothetical protein
MDSSEILTTKNGQLRDTDKKGELRETDNKEWTAQRL